MVGKLPHISDYIFPSLVVIGSKVLQNTTFVLIFYSKSVPGGFYLVDCSSYLLMCRCPMVLFLYFPRCFLMSSVRPVRVFRKPCLIASRRIAVVGLKSAACKYWTSSGFEVYSRMFFTTFYDCCVPRGTSHIPVFLFLVPLIIYFPLFWIEFSYLSSVMAHPSSHKIPNDINGAVFIFGKT